MCFDTKKNSWNLFVNKKMGVQHRQLLTQLANKLMNATEQIPTSGQHLRLKIPKGILSGVNFSNFQEPSVEKKQSLSPQLGAALPTSPLFFKGGWVIFRIFRGKKTHVFFSVRKKDTSRIHFDQPPHLLRPEKFSASFWRAASTPWGGLVKGCER